MNPISSMSAMAFVVYMFFGIYTFKLNKKAYLNRLFLALCLCFSIWAFGYTYIYEIKNIFLIWLFSKLAAVGWCMYYGIVLHLALLLTHKSKFLENKKNIIILYIPCSIMLLVNIFLFRYGITNSNQTYYIYSWFDFVISTSYISTSFVILYMWGRKTKIDKEKKQVKIILTSGLCCFIIGMLSDDLLPLINITAVGVGQVLGIIWVVGIYFAIVKYKLMVISSSYTAEQIISKIRDIIILLDTKMNIIYANPQIINILGYKEEELAGKEYSYIFKYAFKLTDEKYETVCITKDGGEVPVDVMVNPVFDNANDFIGTLLIIHDITEAKQLNNEILQIRQAEASLKNLLDNSRQGFLTIGEDLKIDKEYSTVCRTIFKENIINKSFPEVIFSEGEPERTFFTQIMKAIFNEQDCSRAKLYFSLLQSSVVINKRYVKLEFKMLDEQKDRKLMVILTDVTNEINLKKQIEETLLKNGTCFNLLIENSRDAILVHSDGKLVFANESVAKLLGFIKPEDFSGKSILDLAPVDVRSFISEKFNKVYKEKINLMSFKGKVLKSDGNVIDVENTSTYFIYDGKPTILSILRDITPEKQIEKLQKDVEKNIKLLNETRELNKLITEFFSNISHELKTPLNVIFAGVQTLNLYNDNLDENVKKRSKYLCMMKQNCYRLIKLINNLLDLTKLDSGFVKLNLQNNDIVNVIEEVSMSVVPYLESKGLSLVFDTDVEEKIIACDADKIERIILNLISNSMKFTNPGGEIYVNFMDLNDKIVFSVKDTGVGIPDDKLNIIFDRFGQVDKTLRRNREGSGLGLSLVKSFVEIHGGNIRVKSKVNEGSEFIVEIPVTLLDKGVDDETPYEIDSERISIEFSDIYTNCIETSDDNNG